MQSILKASVKHSAVKGDSEQVSIQYRCEWFMACRIGHNVRHPVQEDGISPGDRSLVKFDSLCRGRDRQQDPIGGTELPATVVERGLCSSAAR